MKIHVRYETNNSGGHWWLKDEDWKALEKAGWKVTWAKDDESYKKSIDEEGRFLGSLAHEAEKDFGNLRDAILEFERITGQKATDEGCNCCGAPHTFWYGKSECVDWKCKHKGKEDKKHQWDFVSGERCLKFLYPDKKVPGDLREAMDMGAKKR